MWTRACSEAIVHILSLSLTGRIVKTEIKREDTLEPVIDLISDDEESLPNPSGFVGKLLYSSVQLLIIVIF